MKSNEVLKKNKKINEWLYLMLGVGTSFLGIFMDNELIIIIGILLLIFFRLTEITRLLLK